MLPKNSKHYILPTAEDLGVDVEMVEDIVSFYYATLRKTLVNLDCPLVQVENLGTFKVKVRELPKLVAKYTKHLEVLSPETFQQMEMKKSVDVNLGRVLNMQSLLKAEHVRKKEFLIKKYGNTGENMES